VAKPCTKFEICSLAVPKLFHERKSLKLVTWPWPRSFHGRLVIRRL